MRPFIKVKVINNPSDWIVYFMADNAIIEIKKRKFGVGVFHLIFLVEVAGFIIYSEVLR